MDAKGLIHVPAALFSVREPSVSNLGRVDVVVVVEKEPRLFSLYSVTTLTELSRLITTYMYTVAYRGGLGGSNPPPKFRNFDKVPKIKKILLYKIKFVVPNYSCLQNP
jgi:hypothetical protein